MLTYCIVISLVSLSILLIFCFFFFFFFQAEDGIRDIGVTGVQTCALPICDRSAHAVDHRCDPARARQGRSDLSLRLALDGGWSASGRRSVPAVQLLARSEERRVGKECRSRWWPDH